MKTLVSISLGLSFLALGLPRAQAGSGTFTGGADNLTWEMPGNWSGNSVPNATTDIATFENLGSPGSLKIINRDGSLGVITANMIFLEGNVSLRGTGLVYRLGTGGSSAQPAILFDSSEVDLREVLDLSAVAEPEVFIAGTGPFGDTTMFNFREGLSNPANKDLIFTGSAGAIVEIDLGKDFVEPAHGAEVDLENVSLHVGRNISQARNFTAGDVVINGGSLLIGGLNSASQARINSLALFGSTFTSGLAVAPLPNLTNPIVLRAGGFTGNAASFTVPVGIDLAPGLSIFQVSASGSSVLKDFQGALTRAIGTTLSVQASAPTHFQFTSVAGSSNGILPWAIYNFIDFGTVDAMGQLGQLTTYNNNINTAGPTEAANVSGNTTLTSSREMVGVKLGAALNLGGNVLTTNAIIGGFNASVANGTIVPASGNEVFVHNGLTLNSGFDIADAPVAAARKRLREGIAVPTHLVVSGGNVLFNGALSKTGDIYFNGSPLVTLTSAANLGGAKIFLGDGGGAPALTLMDATVTQDIEITPPPNGLVITATGNSEIAGDLILNGGAQVARNITFTGQNAGDTLTISGAIHPSSIPTSLAAGLSEMGVACDGAISILFGNGLSDQEIEILGPFAIHKNHVPVGGFVSDTATASVTITDRNVSVATLEAGGGIIDGQNAVIQATTDVTVEDSTLTAQEAIAIGLFSGGGSVTPSSFANVEVTFRNCQIAAGGDLSVGNGGAIPFGTSTTSATAEFNPSFGDVNGSLLLGYDATLRLHIEGLIRSSATALGDYSAIDAGNATLDGILELVFNFPGVQQGDVFELIRLAPGGAFTGKFEGVMVSGLPAGLDVVVEFSGGGPLAGDGPGPSLNARVVAAPAALQVTSAVSRKTHGAAGDFDINLPLTGAPGIECRNGGGSHTLVLTFTNNVVSGNASVTGGTGSVSGSPTFSGNTMTVNLTGVADVQTLDVTFTNVTDSFAQVLPDTTVSANFLLGDATQSNTVNASDVGLVKNQSGVPVTAGNFSSDVVPNGQINASDIAQTKAVSGNFIP